MEKNCNFAQKKRKIIKRQGIYSLKFIEENHNLVYNEDVCGLSQIKCLQVITMHFATEDVLKI
jgi:hypothetical protein